MRLVPKGWGWELWVANSPLYCGKILKVAKGRKCSWHYHKEKDETFYVQDGELRVRHYLPEDFARENATRLALREPPVEESDYCGSRFREVVLSPGDSFRVPPGMRHQFYGIRETTLIEFSTEHKDEDSYRIVKGD